MLPGKLKGIEAELEGPSSVHVSWEGPDKNDGGPIKGYKIMYWDKPESTETIPVGSDVSFNLSFFLLRIKLHSFDYQTKVKLPH